MSTYNIEMPRVTYEVLKYMAEKYSCNIGDLIWEAVHEYYPEDSRLYVETKYKKDADK